MRANPAIASAELTLDDGTLALCRRLGVELKQEFVAACVGHREIAPGWASAIGEQHMSLERNVNRIGP